MPQEAPDERDPAPATPGRKLRAVPLFSQLRDADLEHLGKIIRTREYPKNSIILFARDPCEAFYVLLSGQVKVMLVAEDGREVILSLIRTGDFFGEMALLDDQPQSASVIVMEDSSLLVLHRDDFRRCIHEMPGVAFGLLRALLGRLRDADEKIGGLILLDVNGRVARLLLKLAEDNDGGFIPKPLTHQIIAQMVGSSRETVSRTIRTLANQAVIEVSRLGITIRNREALEAAGGQPLRKKREDAQERGRQRKRSDERWRATTQPDSAPASPRP